MKINLSINDTNALKGIALLLLLFHHLFYKRTGLYDDFQIYNDLYVVNEIGQFSKLCVAIFVFLSGYGLTIQANKKANFQLSLFYKKRFSKLYLNYWFIWILFVPIGVLFFERTFESVYINHIWEKLVIDFLGLSSAFGFNGYNATWWFYSCIIILYLLFPFFYKLLERHKFVLIILGLGIYLSSRFFLWAISQYCISFILGMIVANGININFAYRGGYKYTIVLIIFIGICIIRNRLGWYAILWDNLICMIGIILYKHININRFIQSILEFIGKHSMNIFLFHTFIYYYYFESLIFYSNNPIFIYGTLLFICLFISVILEIIKEQIGFYKIKL